MQPSSIKVNAMALRVCFGASSKALQTVSPTMQQFPCETWGVRRTGLMHRMVAYSIDSRQDLNSSSSTDPDSNSSRPPEPAMRTRQRRKLFATDAAPDEASQQEALAVAVAKVQAERSNSRAGEAFTAQPQQKQQQQFAWPARASLYVYWDVDNLRPVDWRQMPTLIQNLRTGLKPYGSVAQLNGYACVSTLTKQVPGTAEAWIDDGSRGDTWGYGQLTADLDELRCPMCGRRCKSVEELNKHFWQLHEREYEKKMRGTKHFVKKFYNSAKAQKYRDARAQLALPRARRAGKKGQAVSLLLKQNGMRLIQVPDQKQAADQAIIRHVNTLKQQLAAQTEQDHPSSALAAVVLVLVSDDRGFSNELRNWVRAGGGGVVLVTSRQPDEWVNAAGRLEDEPGVEFVDWGDVVDDLDDGAEGDESSDDDVDEQWPEDLEDILRGV